MLIGACDPMLCPICIYCMASIAWCSGLFCIFRALGIAFATQKVNLAKLVRGFVTKLAAGAKALRLCCCFFSGGEGGREGAKGHCPV